MSLISGTRLGPYEIVAPLGAGGMGEVFRARDTRLDREVAVKMLPSATRDHGEARTRFRREALALSRLNHPNARLHGARAAPGCPGSHRVLSSRWLQQGDEEGMSWVR